MNEIIDFEAIQDFYNQIRETLTELSAQDFEVNEYYDLSLIINMVSRDHISALNGFHYTYCKALLYNGFTFDDFTSSRYLFGMLYYIETNDGSLILNTTSDNNYDTSRFYWDLQNDALKEINFFEKHKKALTVAKIKSLLKDKKSWEYKEIITYILEDLYIHDVARKVNKELFQSIKYYMNGEDWKAKSILIDIIADFEIEDFKAAWILNDARKNLLALGYHKNDNDYLKLSLKENILKHKDLGSFDMWVYVLNHIRLAMHQNRKIDISSISLYWTKYYQRKDHSLYSLHAALPVFEKLGFLEMSDSIRLITKIQEISEKGYRGLLADYIIEHPPVFIKHILQNFHPTNLSISWFLLPPEYIDALPDLVYNIEKTSLIKYHRTNKNISYDDIENLLDSNRLDQFRDDLAFYRYSVWIKERSPEIKKLKALKIPYKTYKEQDYSSKKSYGITRLDQGILDYANKGIITEKQLKSYEVAAFSDGNYAALSDTAIYEVFGKEDIKANIKSILYNAMTSRLRTIDYFHILWPFPGNVVKLLNDNEVVDDFQSLYNSFNVFLNMSMFYLKREDEPKLESTGEALLN